MSLEQSTVFFSDLLNIDHTYIDELGMIRGGSFLHSITVSRPINTTGLSLSALKKSILHHLTDTFGSLGFTDRLYVPRLSRRFCFRKNVFEYDSPFVHIKTDCDRVKMIGCKYGELEMANEIQAYLNSCLEYLEINSLYVKNKLKFHSAFDEEENATPPYFFSKVVVDDCGINGSRSFIQLLHEKPASGPIASLAREIVSDINNSIFIKESGLKSYEYSKIVGAVFESDVGEGTEITLFDEGTENVTILPETSAEHIAHFVAEKYKDKLEEFEILGLAVSNGLTDGAIQVLC